MAYETQIPQHKNMACGNGILDGDTFGCKPMDHSKGPSMGEPHGKMMDDDERAPAKPAKRKSAQG